MKKKTGKCKRTMLVLLFALAATALLAGTVTAVTHTEVESVTRTIVPDVVEPDAEFEVTLTISPDAELPVVVGIVETIPEGFSFVSTTHPFYEQSDLDISFAVIAKSETEVSEIRYRVVAPSSGRGSFEGEFVDLLVLSPELEEGKERWNTIGGETMIRVRDVGEGVGAIEEEEVTATPTPFVPAVTKATRVVPAMEAGKEIATTFKDTDVSMIALKADKNVRDVKVEVERIERTPDIPEPSGVAYTYLDITVENAGGAKIEGKIEFKVANSWLTDNGIDEATVKLNRYARNEGWNALLTTKVGEDVDFVYCEAETPGFSMFAVTGEKKEEGETEEEAASTPTPAQAATAAPATAPTPGPTSATAPEPEVPGFGANLPALYLILVFFFATVSLVMVYTKVFRKRGKGRD
jgi:PGF-pre-PGF domain-containing protein